MCTSNTKHLGKRSSYIQQQQQHRTFTCINHKVIFHISVIPIESYTLTSISFIDRQSRNEKIKNSTFPPHKMVRSHTLDTVTDQIASIISQKWRFTPATWTSIAIWQRMANHERRSRKLSDPNLRCSKPDLYIESINRRKREKPDQFENGSSPAATIIGNSGDR